MENLFKKQIATWKDIFFFTLGSNCICQTSDGGDSRVAIVTLVSTSKTRTKLSSDAEAAMMLEGCAAIETTRK